MKPMNVPTVLAVLMVLLTLGSCQTPSTDPGKGASEASSVLSTPDAEGNVIIMNNSGSALYLYDGTNTLLKTIAAGQQDFLVMVKNTGSAVTLQLWRTSDVPNVTTPPSAAIFRKWVVVLNTTAVPKAKCPVWSVSSSTGQSASATLSCSYPAVGSDKNPVVYGVDIFLNGKNGTKLLSLGPGTTDKQVGVSYGAYDIWYRYWYSDPNGTGGATEIDWLHSDAVVNLSAVHTSDAIQAPVYLESPVARAGKILVVNDLPSTAASGLYGTVQIYLDTGLIEDKAVVQVPSDRTNLSTLSPNGVPPYQILYSIPEGSYSLYAKTYPGGTEVPGSRVHVDVLQLQPCQYTLHVPTSDPGWQTLTILNPTSQYLTVHSADPGNLNEYLGYRIPPATTSGPSSTPIKIRKSVTSLKVLNRLTDHSASWTIAGSSWTIPTTLTATPSLLVDAPAQPVAAPTQKFVLADGSQTVQWQAVAGATSYQVFRDTSATGNFTTKVYDGAATTFSDSALTSGQVYYYRFVATNIAGSSPASEVSVPPPLPAAPSDLMISAADASTYKISWTGEPGAISYRIYRDTSATGTFKSLVHEGSETTWPDAKETKGTPNFYKVVSIGDGGIGPMTDAVSIDSTLTVSFQVQAGYTTTATQYFPGVGDDLSLDYFGSDNVWHQVTKVKGTAKYQAMTTVTATVAKQSTPLAFWPNLKFRFSQTSPAGLYSAWELDQVSISQGWTTLLSDGFETGTFDLTRWSANTGFQVGGNYPLYGNASAWAMNSTQARTLTTAVLTVK